MKEKHKRRIKALETQVIVGDEMRRELADDACELWKQLHHLQNTVQELSRELAVAKSYMEYKGPVDMASSDIDWDGAADAHAIDDRNEDGSPIPGPCGC